MFSLHAVFCRLPFLSALCNLAVGFTIYFLTAGGFDYQEFREQVNLTQTQTQHCITISVVDDSFVEPEESFTVILSTTFGHIRFTATQNATIQILDNDSEPSRIIPHYIIHN